MEGKKSVWNLTKNERFDLAVGDYLFTPAGDVHRVKYYEDTEFFIKWDGKWDMFFDEDLEAAKKAIDQELQNGGKYYLVDARYPQMRGYLGSYKVKRSVKIVILMKVMTSKVKRSVKIWMTMNMKKMVREDKKWRC